jgi:endonuclease V-like protein UPF0215 family
MIFVFQHQDHKQEQLKKEAKHTFLSQARQSAASSAAQKTIAKALSQASQRVRIINYLSLSFLQNQENRKNIYVQFLLIKITNTTTRHSFTI